MMSIVGDAYARPIDRRARGASPTTCRRCSAIGTGGATTSDEHKQALFELLPDVMIIDGYGASETGGMAFGARTHGDVDGGVHAGRRRRGAVRGPHRASLEPGDDEIGWTARRGRVPLGYLGDRAAHRARPSRSSTASGSRCPATGPRSRADGIDPAARPRLDGREHRRREGVRRGGRGRAAPPPRRGRRARGRPDERAVRPGGRRRRAAPQPVRRVAAELREFVAGITARFKAPRAIVFCEAIGRHPAASPTTDGRVRAADDSGERRLFGRMTV